jgi:hypothetical protein
LNAVITPSSLWQGTPVEGSRWTREQLDVLQKRGIHPDTAATTTVKRTPKFNLDDWTRPPVPILVEVPHLANAKNGRALVITPAGSTMWLDTNRG